MVESNIGGSLKEYKTICKLNAIDSSADKIQLYVHASKLYLLVTLKKKNFKSLKKPSFHKQCFLKYMWMLWLFYHKNDC